MLGKVRLVLVRIVKVISGVLAYRRLWGVIFGHWKFVLWAFSPKKLFFLFVRHFPFRISGKQWQEGPVWIFNLHLLGIFYNRLFLLINHFRRTRSRNFKFKKSFFFLIKTCSPTVTLKPTRPHFKSFWFDIRL